MSKKVRILILFVIGIGFLICLCWIVFIKQFSISEKYSESFDSKYMYIQLSSPKKTLCTIVILESSGSDKHVSYTLPYFSDSTIKEIVWGLTTNDLFIISRDTGLNIYRNTGGTWTRYSLVVKETPDGTYKHYLYSDNKEQREYLYELSSDTIPRGIITYIIDFKNKDDLNFSLQ